MARLDGRNFDLHGINVHHAGGGGRWIGNDGHYGLGSDTLSGCGVALRDDNCDDDASHDEEDQKGGAHNDGNGPRRHGGVRGRSRGGALRDADLAQLGCFSVLCVVETATNDLIAN